MRFQRGPIKLVAALLTTALVAGGALLLIRRLATGAPAATGSGGAVATRSAQPRASGRRPAVTRRQWLAVHAAIARLRAMHPVPEWTSPQYPAIDGSARQQADLYAAAFAKELLTQDYRSSRDALLAWVQSESARCSEPSVVGLTPPDLRNKVAVASLVDPSAGPPPIPSPQTWAALGSRHGYTTVRIRRVITPPTWTAAVAAGKITDPGVTAREVDADVNLHTTEVGQPQTTTYSVALAMNLEGPPTRDDYGFVTAVTYNVEAGEN